MNFYVGTSGYSYKAWKGAFYPRDLPAKQMLHYYGEHFRAVEINSSFYALPKAAAVTAWMADVPAKFKFILKAPQQMTHRKRLKDCGDSVQQFIKVAEVLKGQLGPLLFQLPPNLKKDLPRLRDFLALLPSAYQAAFEFRHQSWFDDEIFDLLRDHKSALCIADAEDDLKIPFVRTADWGYLRLRRPKYTTAKLKSWIKRAREQDWQNAFVFFKHEDTGTGPHFAARFLELAK